MVVEEPQEPDIPVTILTGFLGAGKTTLLNRILSENHQYKIAVIENEFGPENIDNDLIVSTNKEQIVSMNNGCVCCTIRGDLSRVLTDLRHKRDRGEIEFDYVVLETSGVANPGPVAQTFFMDDAVAAFFRLDGVVTVVDAKYGHETLDKEAAAREQVGFADRILLSKCDLVSEEEALAMEARLRQMNARAPIRRVDMGKCPVSEVLDITISIPSFSNFVPTAFSSPRSTLFPYTTLFRSVGGNVGGNIACPCHSRAFTARICCATRAFFGFRVRTSAWRSKGYTCSLSRTCLVPGVTGLATRSLFSSAATFPKKRFVPA